MKQLTLNKIYFEEADQCKTLDDLLRDLFSWSGYSIETYHDPEFKLLQCKSGSRRSFEDLLAISNTYFPNTTEEQLMQSLKNINILHYHCNDIKKIVFHYSGNHTISAGFLTYKYDPIKEESYSYDELQAILDKIQ